MNVQIPSSSLPISVDIRLCGGIPRSEMDCRGAPWRQLAKEDPPNNALNTSSPAVTVRSKNEISPPAINAQENNKTTSYTPATKENMGILTERQPFTPLFEAPAWAVPAEGHTRLEPIGETRTRQMPIDLTSKPAFRLGRSPASDVQLMHVTSSRRHAMVFHHTNGSCYVIDCGSAHGTFVNGRRVNSCSKGGMIVPHRVRRGAIVRFGGPGAPSFMLKSFSFELKRLIEESATTPDDADLVRRNTQINALGVFGQASDAIFMVKALRKRSYESLTSAATLDEDDQSCKRMRCSSPPLSQEQPLRLISPELSVTTTRRVHFNDTPQCFYPASVTPEELSDTD